MVCLTYKIDKASVSCFFIVISKSVVWDHFGLNFHLRPLSDKYNTALDEQFVIVPTWKQQDISFQNLLINLAEFKAFLIIESIFFYIDRFDQALS